MFKQFVCLVIFVMFLIPNLVFADGGVYIDNNGNVLIQGADPNSHVYVDKNGNTTIQNNGTTNKVNVDNNGNVIYNTPNNNYYVDNKGNVIYTTPNSQYYIDNNGSVIYTTPDKKYNNVTVQGTNQTPYVDNKGAYYLNDIIYSNCDEFSKSDYIVYGSQRQGRSGWEFICQGYSFNTPVVISNMVISSIIFHGNTSGEIGIKVLNDQYKLVFQEKNYKKAIGKTLPPGIYYFYPLVNSDNTKDCTLRVFLNKKS